MDSSFLFDFRESLERITCLRSPINKSLELNNFSTILENVETLHSRNNSCSQEDNLLSHTMPMPKISSISKQVEFDLNSYKQLVSSIKSNNLSLFRKLSKSIESLQYLNKKKRTFLHISSKYGSLEIAQLILAYSDININSRDELNQSALHLAAKNGHVGLVKFLSRCGGYLHIKDKFNKSPIDYAIESKNLELIQFVFEKSPSLCKSFGFNIQELLKTQGISLQLNQKTGNDEKSKVKKVEEPAESVGFDDFSLIKELGRGSFGFVYLAKHLATQRLFAMKIMLKEKIFKERLEEYICTEKEIMSCLESEFIVKLHFAFQTSQFFCLVIDYCPGGTLADVLKREGRLSENKAKKYLSEIVISLECLHNNNIIYRDLKPENVLIDDKGHIKLTDFGLSKTGIHNGQNATSSFCGTACYLAPEIIEKKGYGKSVDWYSFGVLIYEILTGETPKKNEKTKEIKFPKFLSAQCRNIIGGLVCSDFKARLGSRSSDQIRFHEFFSDVNWEAVRLREVRMDVPVLRESCSCLIEEKDLPQGSHMKSMKNWSFIDPKMN